MKKIIMTVLIAMSSVSAVFAGRTPAFGGEEKINARVLDAFNKEFRTAKEISWTVAENYYEATFVYNDEYISAYYNTDGELIGLTRNISLGYLPLTLQNDLMKNYKDYWVSGLFEVNKDSGTSYYITVEDADSKIVLRATDGISWSVHRKVKKA